MKGLLKSLHRGRSRSPSKTSHTQGTKVVDSVEDAPTKDCVSGKEQKTGRFPSRRRQEKNDDAGKENNHGNSRFPSRFREVLAGVKDRGRFPSPQRSSVNDVNPKRRPSPLRRIRSARKNDSRARAESPSRRPFRFLNRPDHNTNNNNNTEPFNKVSPTSATTEPINSPLSLIQNESDDNEIFLEQKKHDSSFEDFAEASDFVDCTDAKVKEEITALRQGLQETSNEETSVEMELLDAVLVDDDDDDDQDDDFQDCLQALPEEESCKENTRNVTHIVTPDSKHSAETDSPCIETDNATKRRGHSPVRPGSPSRTLNSETQLVVLDSFKYNKLLPTDLSSVALDRVFNEITTWTEMIHKGKMVPRLVTMQGDVDEYGTEPLFRGNFSYQPALHSWTPMVKVLRDILSEKLDQPLNHAVICCFRNGEDYLSESSSNTLDTATGSPIVKLSLGSSRTMILRPKRMNNGERVPSPRPTTKIELAHGSVLRLGPETNRRMTHEIKRYSHYFPTPGDNPESEEGETASSLLTKNANFRICITFRHVLTFRDGASGQVFGKGALSKTVSSVKDSVDGSTLQESDEMMNAFQNEIRNSNFDQVAHFGKGFDSISHQTICSSFFTLPLLENPEEIFYDALSDVVLSDNRPINKGRRSRRKQKVKGSRSFSQERPATETVICESRSFGLHDKVYKDEKESTPVTNSALESLPEPKWRKKPDWNVGTNTLNASWGDNERKPAGMYRQGSRHQSLRRTMSEPSILPGHVKKTSEWFENLFRLDDDKHFEDRGPTRFRSSSWRNCAVFSDSPAFMKCLRRSKSEPCLTDDSQGIPSLKQNKIVLSSPVSFHSSGGQEFPSSESSSKSLDKTSLIFRTASIPPELDDKGASQRNAETNAFNCDSELDVEDDIVFETPFEIHPTREKHNGIALLAVDLVNDFLADDPSFYFGKLGSPIAPRRKDLLDRIRDLANETRRMGGVCFFVRSRYGAWSAPQKGSRKSRPAGAHMEKVECCGAGSEGADFHPDTDSMIVNTDIILQKEWYSAFMGTLLDKQLQRLKVGTVVVCGLTTNHSVSATVRSARNLGYNVILSSDGTAQLDHRTQGRSEKRLGPFVQTLLQKGQSLDSVVSPEPCVGHEAETLMDEPALDLDCFQRTSGFGAGDSIIIPNFMDGEAADALLASLAPDSVECEKKSAGWQVLGGEGKVLTTRKHLVEPNAQGHVPVYRGHGPKPWERDFSSTSFDEVEALKNAVQTQTGHTVNFGQTICYRGSDYQDFNAEQNLDLNQGSFVAAVALGGDRVLELKPKKPGSSLAPQRIQLTHNSLVLLGPETTRLFLHATPAIEEACEPHIQVTFMDVATFFAKDVSRGVPALYGAGTQFSSHSDLEQAESMQRVFEQTGMAIAGAYALSVLRPGRGGSLMVTVMGAAIASAATAMWFRREREKLWNEEQKALDDLLYEYKSEPISQEEARHKIYRAKK